MAVDTAYYQYSRLGAQALSPWAPNRSAPPLVPSREAVQS